MREVLAAALESQLTFPRSEYVCDSSSTDVLAVWNRIEVVL